MTRGTMRALLRRRINEATADDFSDSALNDLLNEGLHQVQKEVLKLDAEAFIYIDQTSIAPGLDLYPLPPGFWYEYQVQVYDSTQAKYAPILRKDYEVLQSWTGALHYARIGRFLALGPIPSTAITNGLRILYVPTLEMAADNDVPDLHTALHIAAVFWAQLFVYGETSEAIAPVKEALAELIADIPSYYRRGGDNERWKPQIDKGYGHGSGLPSNSQDFR